jgi:putative ABC transport system ATP-binding protein
MPLQAIRFNQVNFSADGMHILKNITGSFPKGKITTLVGPSGAGKTSLFRLCNGLRTADSGEIFINEKLITEYNPVDLRVIVGIALQSATMVDGTVFDNLALPLRLKGEQLSEEDAKHWLELVGLEEKFLHHKADDLSGGQRQKVSIARTLVNRPEILLLDEITSALDRVSQQDIEDLIARINKKYGTTIIWITHNLTQALKVGHFTWVMMNGEVVETGETSLLQSPKDERVRQFVKGEEI